MWNEFHLTDCGAPEVTGLGGGGGRGTAKEEAVAMITDSVVIVFCILFCFWFNVGKQKGKIKPCALFGGCSFVCSMAQLKSDVACTFFKMTQLAPCYDDGR